MEVAAVVFVVVEMNIWKEQLLNELLCGRSYRYFNCKKIKPAETRENLITIASFLTGLRL